MNRLIVSFLILFGWCFAKAEEKPPPQFGRTPQAMSLFIGGWEKSYEVWDGRELHYFSADSEFLLNKAKPEILKPTKQQWEDFFQALAHLKVWKWEKRYENRNVVDGTQWRAIVVFNTTENFVISSGDNAYPPNFKDFLKSVQKLIGNKEFR